jgi:predicted DNA-binding transcriptional regulator AlpA
VTDRLLTIKEVRKVIPLRQTTINDRMARGLFPRPQKVGRVSFWRESDIQAYIAELFKE